MKFEARTATGIAALSAASTSGSAPRLLRLVRSGPIITAYVATDGTTWTTLAPSLTALNFSGDFLAGIAVTANNTTTRTTRLLSQLSNTGFVGPLWR